VLPDWAKADRPTIKRQPLKSNPIPANLRLLPASKPQLLTVDQAAERLVVSSRTVRRMINDGRLKHVNIGRAVRVSEAALAAFILGEKA
jgi:excisionase family DNA binding protein